MPRCFGSVRAYLNKISFCAPMFWYRRGLLRQNSLSVPRYPGIDGAYYGKILICAPMYKGGGYNRPDFVSHTRFRKFCWVQIACFWLLYPRQQVLLGTDSLFLNSIPSSTQIHKNTDRQISSLSISIFVCQYLLHQRSVTAGLPSHPRTPAAFLRKEPW